jgi:AcrR family transcriptional regulator
MAQRDPKLRPPRQARSQATLERVLDVGVALVEEGDWNAFTIAEVCRRAEVHVGSFYARFSSKEALLLAVQERILKEVEREESTAFANPDWAGLSTPELIDCATREIPALFCRHAGVLRMLMSRAAVDPRVRVQGFASARRLGEAYVACLLQRRDELGHPDPELGVWVCARVLLDGLARRITAPPELRAQVGWDDYVDQLVLMVKSFLIAPYGSSSPA